MKRQILISRKNKNNISKCRLLKFLPSMQSANSSFIVGIYITANAVSISRVCY